jgi:hypothetical protein
MPQDCIDAKKRYGQRIFDYGLSTIYNQDSATSAFTTMYRALGVRTVAIIWSENDGLLVSGAVQYAIDNLISTNFEIVLKYNYSDKIAQPTTDETNLALALQLKELNPGNNIYTVNNE